MPMPSEPKMRLSDLTEKQRLDQKALAKIFGAAPSLEDDPLYHATQRAIEESKKREKP